MTIEGNQSDYHVSLNSLYDLLKTHTRTIIVTKGFPWKENDRHFRSLITCTPINFACFSCMNENVRTHPLRAYDRGFAIELLHLFSKMAELPQRKLSSRKLLVLYLDRLSSREAEMLVYLLRITPPDFSLQIFIEETDFALIKERLPFQYQILCDSINTLIQLSQNKKTKPIEYELKLPL